LPLMVRRCPLSCVALPGRSSSDLAVLQARLSCGCLGRMPARWSGLLRVRQRPRPLRWPARQRRRPPTMTLQTTATLACLTPLAQWWSSTSPGRANAPRLLVGVCRPRLGSASHWSLHLNSSCKSCLAPGRAEAQTPASAPSERAWAANGGASCQAAQSTCTLPPLGPRRAPPLARGPRPQRSSKTLRRCGRRCTCMVRRPASHAPRAQGNGNGRRVAHCTAALLNLYDACRRRWGAGQAAAQGL
jgi:hypothetical protein